MGSAFRGSLRDHVHDPVLESMNILVKVPVTVTIGDVGAIFMASNVATMSCKKYINTKYNSINEYVEDGVVEIVFIKSAIETFQVDNSYKALMIS